MTFAFYQAVGFNSDVITDYIKANDNGDDISLSLLDLLGFDYSLFDQAESQEQIDILISKHSDCFNNKLNRTQSEFGDSFTVNDDELEVYKNKIPELKRYLKLTNGEYRMPRKYPNVEITLLNTKSIKDSIKKLTEQLKSYEVSKFEDFEMVNFISFIIKSSVNNINKNGSESLFVKYQ